MKTKFIASLTVILEHQEGARLTRKAVAQYLKDVIEGVVIETQTPAGRTLISAAKVVVRDVDKD